MRESHEQSPLEELPAEVVQLIFEYSKNIALPLVSRQLAVKLSHSSHLQLQLASLLLSPVLGCPDQAPVPQDLINATRLLNSRFMSWDFFREWLQSSPQVSALLSEIHDHNMTSNMAELWSALRPAPGLLPPRKLLLPPFTDDKTSLLGVLAPHVKDINMLDSAYGELAFEGLAAAVEQGAAGAVSLLLSMGLRSSTELLRNAVADAGCDENIVRILIAPCSGGAEHDHGIPSSAETSAVGSDVDLLDPVLWAWAEKAKTRGDAKGEWLMGILRDAHHRHGDVEV